MQANRISIVLLYEDRASGQRIGTMLEQTQDYTVKLVPATALQLNKLLEDEKADAVLFAARVAGLAAVSAAQKVANECNVPVVLIMPTDGMSRYGDKENLYCMTYSLDKATPEEIVREINTKIRVAITSFRSQAVRQRMKAERQNNLSAETNGRTGTEEAASVARTAPQVDNSRKLIAIGASAGGTEAIYHVMVKLPDDLPGIVIVQHMPEGFTDMYAKRLDMNCAMKVVQASNAQKIERGCAYIAAGGKQMQIKRNSDGYYIHLYEGERVSGHIPSVDVLFDSVAKCAGKNALGVILTGMGSDGAKGLLALRETGAYTLGQNQETCLVYGMPRVAFEAGAVAEQVALEDIPPKIIQYAESR